MKFDDVNQFSRTAVPVLAVIFIKLLWVIINNQFRLLQPYISLAKGPTSAQSSIAVDYQSTLEGWI